MKIIISQPTEIIGDKFPHRWSKEFISSVIPHTGDFIQDPIWQGDEYYEVSEVILNYELDECYVSLEKYKTKISEDRKDFFADMAESHDWKCSWRLTGTRN